MVSSLNMALDTMVDEKLLHRVAQRITLANSGDGIPESQVLKEIPDARPAIEALLKAKRVVRRLNLLKPAQRRDSMDSNPFRGALTGILYKADAAIRKDASFEDEIFERVRRVTGGQVPATASDIARGNLMRNGGDNKYTPDQIQATLDKLAKDGRITRSKGLNTDVPLAERAAAPKAFLYKSAAQSKLIRGAHNVGRGGKTDADDVKDYYAKLQATERAKVSGTLNPSKVNAVRDFVQKAGIKGSDSATISHALNLSPEIADSILDLLVKRKVAVRAASGKFTVAPAKADSADTLFDHILAMKDKGGQALRDAARRKSTGKDTDAQYQAAKKAYDVWADAYSAADRAYDEGDEKAAAQHLKQAEQLLAKI